MRKVRDPALAVRDLEAPPSSVLSALPSVARFGVEALLVSQLRERRKEIAGMMLDHAIRRAELTVGAEVLALAFVDRFIAAIDTHDWPAFFSWIDRTCEKHAARNSLLRLIAGGAAVIASQADDGALDVPAVRADFVAVADRIGRIVAQPRTACITVAQPLDEVDATLDRLVMRLSNFDVATAEHSRAVSMWCARIGKKLALTPAETTYVMRAGLIHDIGKVTTPPEILNAPYRLSEPDMTIMRRHAEAGAAIVSEIPQLEHLTPAVRAHHERIDGRGYPDGREGSEIPIIVRIVSVADSFNAMIGNRPYRLPMAPTLALEQLRAHSGTQFDSNVVNAMIDVVRIGR